MDSGGDQTHMLAGQRGRIPRQRAAVVVKSLGFGAEHTSAAVPALPFTDLVTFGKAVQASGSLL